MLSGYVNSLLLKMAIEIMDFPINSMVIFHSFLYVYQRVSSIMWCLASNYCGGIGALVNDFEDMLKP